MLDNDSTTFYTSGTSQNNQSWIEVDFTSWGSGIQDRVRFDLLRSAILNRQQLTFHYFGSDGKETIRKVEPLRMLFKGQNWYLQAFCLTRQDFRLFKLFRI
ncbi:MAG: WYL domain-containing protein, partial [Eubacterium sp.]